jgi:hypothetical protein
VAASLAWCGVSHLRRRKRHCVVLAPPPRFENRIKVGEAFKHPRIWIANTLEPSHIIVLGLAIALAGAIWSWQRGVHRREPLTKSLFGKRGNLPPANAGDPEWR